MRYYDSELEDKPKQKSNAVADTIRAQILQHAKSFKTSWVSLGRCLYSVYQDKHYYGWGHEKFEDYVEKEVGIKKATALKMLKAYIFLEEDEPAYLKEDFSETRKPNQVPGVDELSVLRLAKMKKELNKDDYRKLKAAVFDKGKDASALRKDLVSLMKERKPVNPEEERELRNEAAIRRLVNSLKSFKKDMDSLKLLPDEVIVEAKGLLEKLETHLP